MAWAGRVIIICGIGGLAKGRGRATRGCEMGKGRPVPIGALAIVQQSGGWQRYPDFRPSPSRL